MISALLSLGMLLPGAGRVALVTGATRGIGKGIAVELGQAGYCVHCVGRSSRAGGQTSERPVAASVGELTVEATAEAVTAAGGRGVAVAADMADDAAVAAVVQGVVSAEGRLDVLVCSAFTTPPDLGNASFRDDFWKQGAPMWDAVHLVGLRSVYLACCAAAPPMIETAAATGATPLIALVSSFGGKAYTFNVPYGVGKAAVDRLGADMALQLGRHGVATTTLYPGVVRTEGNVEMDARGEWAAASGGLDLGAGESPALTGRALASLLRLGGAELLARSGGVEVVAELAREFGFTDVDGRTPPSIRSLAFLLPNYVFPQVEAELPAGARLPAWLTSNVPDVLLPWSIFTSGPPPTANQE